MMVRIVLVFLFLFFDAKTYADSECPTSDTRIFGFVLGAITAVNYRKFSKSLLCLKDVNYQDENGATLLMYASGYLEFLTTASDDQKLKSGLIRHSNDLPAMVSSLLRRGADARVSDLHGNTALMSSVYHNRIASTWLILKKGGGADISSSERATLLSIVNRGCYTDMSELLKDFGITQSVGFEGCSE